MVLAGVGRLDQADEIARAERDRRVDLEEERLDERERRVVLGEQSVAEPVGGQLPGPEVLAEDRRRQVEAVSRFQEPAPGLEPHLLARVARQQEVGGELADVEIVVVGQPDQLVDGQVPGVGPGVLGGVGPGGVGGGVEQPEHGLVQAERAEGGLLEAWDVVEDPDREVVDRDARGADQAGDPARLDLAERGAEVGLQRLGGEAPDVVAPGPFEQAE